MTLRAVFFASLFLLFIALSACLSIPAIAQTPEWVEKNQDKRYPPDRYWLGISSAVGAGAEEKAKESAKKEIAAQFKTIVKAKTIFSKKEENEGEKSTFAQSLNEKIETLIENVELTGVQVAEIHKQGIRVFALAVLNKAEFLRPLREELNSYQTKVREKLKTAESFSAKDFSTAVNAFLEALHLIDEAETKREFFNRISGETFIFSDKVQSQQIESALRTALGDVQLEIVSGNGQSGELGKAFKQPLVVKATSKSGSPLRGLSLVFSVEETPLGKVITDNDGVAFFSPIAQADGVTGGKGKITAAIELKQLSTQLRNELRQNTTVTFEFSLPLSVFECELDLSAIDSERAKQSLEQKIVSALTKNGAVLKGNAALIAKASIDTSESTAVQGMNGQMLVKDITLTLQFQKRDGSIVSSVSFSSTGLGKDNDSAIDKGLSEMRISSSKLAEPIAKARSSE